MKKREKSVRKLWLLCEKRWGSIRKFHLFHNALIVLKISPCPACYLNPLNSPDIYFIFQYFLYQLELRVFFLYYLPCLQGADSVPEKNSVCYRKFENLQLPEIDESHLSSFHYVFFRILHKYLAFSNRHHIVAAISIWDGLRRK